MLLLQRLRPQIYRNVFIKIMKTQLASLRLKIQVFGFTAFDAFVVNALFKGTLTLSYPLLHTLPCPRNNTPITIKHTRPTLSS